VLLFASYGVDAAGVEISESAVSAANAHAETQGPVAGKATFVVGDFYKEDWVRELGAHEDGFDFVYDYTVGCEESAWTGLGWANRLQFLCAMPPELRPAWAKRMAELVKPASGYLVCLEFPLYKGLETGGPPWGLTSKVYEELLSERFEKIIHYKPGRTHPIGAGTDYMAVWRRKLE
jgi:hypothetical protein